jgi:hypothetical protein
MGQVGAHTLFCFYAVPSLTLFFSPISKTDSPETVRKEAAILFPEVDIDLVIKDDLVINEK